MSAVSSFLMSCFYEGKQLGLWVIWINNMSNCYYFFLTTGSKRDAEDRIVPRHEDADDSDVEVKSDDERLLH